MVRFFVEPEMLQSTHISLIGDNADHAKVLRIKQGEQVTLCDGQGNEALCVVDRVENGCWNLSVLENMISDSEAQISASVYMAFPKGDKLEHVIQKATELGANEVVVFPSARCISKPDDKSIRKKLERWQKIAASAAEQSGRGRIPRVVVLKSFDEALNRAAKSDIAIMFYEHEQSCTLQAVLSERTYKTISLLTGPEGGLEEQETKKAIDAGLRVCTLGKRILRCETAPLCALSAVMYDSGEF